MAGEKEENNLPLTSLARESGGGALQEQNTTRELKCDVANCIRYTHVS